MGPIYGWFEILFGHKFYFFVQNVKSIQFFYDPTKKIELIILWTT